MGGTLQIHRCKKDHKVVIDITDNEVAMGRGKNRKAGESVLFNEGKRAPANKV
jgi:hypothetical protein